MRDDFTIGNELLSGDSFTQSAVNFRTGKVAVAVFADYKLLSSWNFVFIVDPITGNKSLLQLPVKGRLPAYGRTAAFESIESLRFDSSGRLHVIDVTPAENTTEYIYNPDLSLYQCNILKEGEGKNRCAELLP